MVKKKETKLEDYKDALCALIDMRIAQLKKAVKSDNKTVKEIIEATIITELTNLKKIILKSKKAKKLRS